MLSYLEFISEAFVLPPRDLARWLDLQIKRWKAYSDQLEEFEKEFKEWDNDEEESLRYVLTDVYDNNLWMQDVETLLHSLSFKEYHRDAGAPRFIEYFEEAKKVLKEMEGKSMNDNWQNERFLKDLFRYSAETLERTNEKEHVWKSINDFIGYTQKLRVPESDLQHYNLDAIQFIRKLRRFATTGMKLFLSTKQKVDDFQAHISRQFRRNDSDTEILYHATFFADNLEKNGFSPETKPEDKSGLGGSAGWWGENNKPIEGISFTWDLYVAKEIARSFKEVALIAKGEINLRQIKEWAEKEGIWDDVFGYISRDYAFKKEDERRDTVFGKIGGPKWTGSPYQIFELYRVFLTFSKKRYNPVYFGKDEGWLNKIAKLDYSGIGVIKAEVDVSDLDFNSQRERDQRVMPAEKEIRVTPDKIIRVLGVIK